MEKKIEEKLVELALDARINSYCPYSKYAVGSALICSDGTVYTGANIENASYGETVCAERTAVFKAVSEGRRDFVAIAICGGIMGEDVSDFAYPCGSCRQVLSEFSNNDIEIIVYNGEEIKTIKLSSLLPNSFSKTNLT